MRRGPQVAKHLIVGLPDYKRREFLVIPTPVRPPPLETLPVQSLAGQPVDAFESIRQRPTRQAPFAHEMARPSMMEDIPSLVDEEQEPTPVSKAHKFPPELAVPVRTNHSRSSSDLGHRSAFVLMHVDGTTPIISIAKLVGLPLVEVMACFHELVASGMITLRIGGKVVEVVGQSGVFPCTED